MAKGDEIAPLAASIQPLRCIRSNQWLAIFTCLTVDIQYLNTDLEIESKSDLSRIVEEFGDDVFVHHHGEIRGYQHASFSIAGGSADADATINSLCTLIEQLPRDVRQIWDGCCSRVLDIGYESGTSAKTFRSEIRPATIQRVAELGASIVITIYPETKESASGSAPHQDALSNKSDARRRGRERLTRSLSRCIGILTNWSDVLA